MQVQIYQATITVEEKTKPLTKAIAKQFPIDYSSHGRWDNLVSGVSAMEPICKVNATTIDKDLTGWLYLVENLVAGLQWVRPILKPKSDVNHYPDAIWDQPSKVPTVIL